MSDLYDDQLPPEEEETEQELEEEEEERTSFMRRTQIMRRLAAPKEISSAVRRLFASPLLQKRCKLNVAPDDDTIEELTLKVKAFLDEQKKEIQIERIEKKEGSKTFSSLYSTDMLLFVTAVQNALFDRFRLEINDTNQKLLHSILDMPEERPKKKSGNYNILVVEDNPNTLRIIKTLLKKDGRFNTTTAEDGEEALKCIVDKKFDVVLCDINLPKIHGLEVLRLARTKQENRRIKFLMLSAFNTPDIIKKAMSLGARDYIVKPFKASILMEKINSHVTAPK